MSIAVVSEVPLSDDTGEYLIRQLLAQVGVNLKECHKFSVIEQPFNDILQACGPKATAIPGLPEYAKGRYIQAEFSNDLQRLADNIRRVSPNVIISLDRGSALALTGSAKIKNIRGAVAPTRLGPKAVFTYGPRSVQRDWTLRPIVLSDLDKARRESAYPDIRRPRRSIWIEPTLSDLIQFEKEYFHDDPLLSVDIETAKTQITCIGFAPSADVGIVIPFHAAASPDANYWRNPADEKIAWGIVRRWCETYRSLFQNGLYDINFLWTQYGIRCLRAEHDTMLLHHALQPEMQKGLGFLATLYTDESSWKFMRTKNETAKREDT